MRMLLLALGLLLLFATRFAHADIACALMEDGTLHSLRKNVSVGAFEGDSASSSQTFSITGSASTIRAAVRARIEGGTGANVPPAGYGRGGLLLDPGKESAGELVDEATFLLVARQAHEAQH